MSRQQEILILGAVEAIKVLAADQDDKRSLLRKVFPYLTQSDLDHWIEFYRL
jgi:hypothetical protein